MKKTTKKKTPAKGAARWGGSPAQYLSAGFAGLVIAAAAAFFQGFALGQPAYLNARHCSDGCFVAAALIGGVGALVWVSTTGFFDILSYGARNMQILLTSLWRHKEHQNFLDYKTMRAEKRGKPLYFLLVVGLFYLLISLICLGLYYNLPN